MHKRWKEKENGLTTEFTFKSFEDAMQFMQEAAKEISRIDHHPEWSNVYGKVSVRLTTHDAGNKITQKDLELAVAMDQVYEQLTHSGNS